MAKLRECIVCGTKYKYCRSCSQAYNPTETWRSIYCCENCRSIYHVIDKFRSKKIDAKEAQKQIELLDKPAKYTDFLQEFIDKIYAVEDKKEKETGSKFLKK